MFIPILTLHFICNFPWNFKTNFKAEIRNINLIFPTSIYDSLFVTFTEEDSHELSVIIATFHINTVKYCFKIILLLFFASVTFQAQWNSLYKSDLMKIFVRKISYRALLRRWKCTNFRARLLEYSSVNILIFNSVSRCIMRAVSVYPLRLYSWDPATQVLRGIGKGVQGLGDGMLVMQSNSLMFYFVTLKFSMLTRHPLLVYLSWMTL
jgi:hypothetical protein